MLSVFLIFVSTHLDLAFYTLKAVRYEPERANCPENLKKRRKFVENLLQIQSQNLSVCYMDETNFNIHISRIYRGSRSNVVATASKGANVHTIGCINPLGLVHYEIKQIIYQGGSTLMDAKVLKESNRDAWRTCCDGH